MSASTDEPTTTVPPSTTGRASVFVDADSMLWPDNNPSRFESIVRALRSRFGDTSVFALYTVGDVSEDMSTLASSCGAMWEVHSNPLTHTTMDTEMANRARRELPLVDLLVIASDDAYFREVLDEARESGVRTLVVVNSTSSSGLTAAADEWLSVEDLLIGAAPRSTTLMVESFSTDTEPSKPDPEREYVKWLDDAPVDVDLDSLGRDSVAKVLEDNLRTLFADNNNHSFLVHIDGPWGAGKSTLMRFVAHRMIQPAQGEETWLAIWYDAWRQSKAGPPYLTLLETIRKGVRTGQDTHLARLWLSVRERARLVSQWQWVAVGLLTAAVAATIVVAAVTGFTLTKWGDFAKLAAGVVPVIGAAWLLAGSVGRFATLSSKRAAKSFIDNRADPMEDLAEHFRWILAQAGRPVLLLIDDLDRCPEEHVVDVLEIIQKLLRDPVATTRPETQQAGFDLAILVAADGRWIKSSYDNAYRGLSEAVSEPGASIGSLFLQKLFQLTLSVPRLSEVLREQYVADILDPMRELNRRSYKEATELLARRLDEAQSSEEAFNAYKSAPQEARIRVADRAVEKLVIEASAQAYNRHLLEPFAPLVDPTPRALKRFAMAFDILRAVRIAEGSDVGARQLALWTVLTVGWPALADFLQRHPDAVRLFGTNDERTSKDLPRELAVLFTDPPNELRKVMNHPAGPLDETRIRECTGQLLRQQRPQQISDGLRRSERDNAQG